ncbi:MAG: hypothetical protein KDC98_03010 [Planctomycetes bacterium]|nr:hypothetical protein [Planctomycetota bacterium]
MTHPASIEVVRDGDRDAPNVRRRAAMAVTLTCFAGVLGGLAIRDLLTVPDDSARRLALAKGLELAPGVDPRWLDTSPPPLPKREVPQRMLGAWSNLAQRMVHCELNETALLALWQKGTGLAAIFGADAPREFDVFTMPNNEAVPRFRYPPLVTFPDGLTTNSFGFRGPDLALNKAAATVRIAVVGASAAIDDHHFAWSFPELIGHWLELWSEANDLGVHFEVINAGRESIVSTEIRAIVQYEVLPLAVDYIAYYEGQNQFGPAHLLRHVEVDGEFTPGQPPPESVTDLRMVDEHPANLLDRAAPNSANARRLRRVLGSYDDLPEPPKPTQRLVLPQGLDELHPDLARAGELLQLGIILPDLDGIRIACDAVHCRLVMCSFHALVHPGLRCDLKEGHSLYHQLNHTYWPLSYDSLQRLSDLQNRYFEAWAAARNVPFLDVANWLPDDPVLFSDMVHASESGSRMRAWVMFCGLIPILERDLRSGAVPVPDTTLDTEHPFLGPTRHVTAAALDAR